MGSPELGTIPARPEKFPSNKVKKGARFFIFGNSRNSEIGRAQDFCVKTNKSQ
jgi:hypothetical protein